VIESPAMVLTSDKSLDNYMNWMGAVMQSGLPRYIGASRTVTLVEAPWLRG